MTPKEYVEQFHDTTVPRKTNNRSGRSSKMRKRRILRRRSAPEGHSRPPLTVCRATVCPRRPDFGFDLPPFDRYTPGWSGQHREVILIFSAAV